MDFSGKRVTVMGLGSFGGGVGAVQFLAERGALVTVTDRRTQDELAESLQQISGLPLAALHLGGHAEDDFRDIDLLVVNPAIRPSSPFAALARRAGVPITTEVRLLCENNRGRVIGVTGSRGKSTTAAMIHTMLKSAGFTCWLGGNIGGSLLPVVDQIREQDWVVLELSSYQLTHLSDHRHSPEVAVVTNFIPTHTEWHGSVTAYRSAKQNILRSSKPNQIAILNSDDQDIVGWPTSRERFWFGQNRSLGDGMFGQGREAVFRSGSLEEVVPLADWISLLGRHNFTNALAGSCCARKLGVGWPVIESALRGFEALPHRLQLVAEVAGRRFFNDSVACSPASTLAALASFQERVVLLAGGDDEGKLPSISKPVSLRVADSDDDPDFYDLAKAIAQRAKIVALYGRAAAKLKQLIRKYDTAKIVRCECHESLTRAFHWAVEQSAAGDTVLFSPGCAPTDQYPNFRERGDVFIKLVQTSKGKET